MVRMTFVLFAFVSAALAGAQDLSPYLCNDSPAVQVTADLPVALRWVTLTATADNSGGVVEAVNNSTKAIQQYLIIMQFSDANGKYLFSSPIYTSDKDQNISFD